GEAGSGAWRPAASRYPMMAQPNSETDRWSPPSGVSSALGPLLYLLGQLRNHLEQVPHDTEVGELEDRGLGILVDHHDGLGGLHAGPVLDRPGDAHRQVQLRRHGL